MIEVEQLSKVYGTTAAIQDVNFSVEPGEILGFLGPNGAGKTTTMRILTGYLPATSGTARVAGFDVHDDSMAVRERIGYLPETPPLYPEMTVEGFLHFVARLKHIPAGDRTQRVYTAMHRCNILEKRHTLIRKLSKGFRQRVGIAQAIVHDPAVIILDEPTVGLDPRQIIDVRHLIRSLAGDHTIILSTHILPEVSATCDRITIINQGSVVATNTPEELVAQLHQGMDYRLELEGEFEAVRSALQGLPAVKSVESFGLSDRTSRYGVRIQLEEDQADPGADIAAIVTGNGLRLYELRRSQASLEDVFLQLTMADVGQSLDADSASSTAMEAEASDLEAIASPENTEDTEDANSSGR
jgi:ABC-2 type transport system ATP-binding protein